MKTLTYVDKIGMYIFWLSRMSKSYLRNSEVSGESQKW